VNRRSFLRTLGLVPIYIAGGLALLKFAPAAAEAWVPTVSGMYHPLMSRVMIAYNPASKPSCSNETKGAWEATWSIGKDLKDRVNYGTGCVDKERLLKGLPTWVNGSIQGYENKQRFLRS